MGHLNAQRRNQRSTKRLNQMTPPTQITLQQQVHVIPDDLTPTSAPSSVPTYDPTSAPSSVPIYDQISAPSSVPIYDPTSAPSSVPIYDQTSAPSSIPT